VTSYLLWPGISIGITTTALLLVLCIVLSAVFVVVADRNEKQS
jgi:cell division protein FtsL